MGMFNKFKDLIGVEDFEDEEEMVEFEEETYKQPSYQERKTPEIRKPLGSQDGRNVMTMQNKTVKSITNAFKLVVIEPQSFEECSKLVDSLRSRKPIIVNIEKLDSDTGRKIFDFLNGATYALNGSVQKIANGIFLFAPENVAIFAEGESKPYAFGGTNDNPWK